jgi:hypothetical protein
LKKKREEIQERLKKDWQLQKKKEKWGNEEAEKKRIQHELSFDKLFFELFSYDLFDVCLKLGY